MNCYYCLIGLNYSKKMNSDLILKKTNLMSYYYLMMINWMKNYYWNLN